MEYYPPMEYIGRGGAIILCLILLLRSRSLKRDLARFSNHRDLIFFALCFETLGRIARRHANARLVSWQTKEGLWSHRAYQITPIAFLQPLPLFGAFLPHSRILSFQENRAAVYPRRPLVL